jgi:hypothetical protein
MLSWEIFVGAEKLAYAMGRGCFEEDRNGNPIEPSPSLSSLKLGAEEKACKPFVMRCYIKRDPSSGNETPVLELESPETSS